MTSVHDTDWIIKMRNYALGGLATVSAATFTNPLDVVKTRLQLQGELAKSAKRPYRGVLSGLWAIGRAEGIRGVQKGLTSAALYQFTMNSMRLGSYGVFNSLLGADDPSAQWLFARHLVSGAVAGVMGATLASPWYMVKTRIQAQSSGSLTVGTQHRYRSSVHALRHIVRSEGVRGLWRGSSAAALRVAVGSATQLASYDLVKGFAVQVMGDNWTAWACSALGSGFMVSVTMTPFDVVSTRMYNQLKGQHYSNPFDCLRRTVAAEGPLGLYKGFSAQWFRVVPHTLLTFLFFEQYQSLSSRWFPTSSEQQQ